MQQRTIVEVSAEFRAEGHLPMLQLVELIKQADWMDQLVFDTSMLRLWASRKNANSVEIMVTYGDGRFGGRPSNMNLGTFDLSLLRNGAFEVSSSNDANAVLEKIRLWLDMQRPSAGTQQ